MHSWPRPTAASACFWHGRIALAVVCRRVLKRKPCRVMISNSPDGEFIARTVERLGVPAIRGSSTTDTRRQAPQPGGLRCEAVRFIEAGGVVAITPDGPRGPAQQMPEGPVALARASGAPVFLFGLAAQPALKLKTWDRTQIPLPFGRGCVVFDGPAGSLARDRRRRRRRRCRPTGRRGSAPRSRGPRRCWPGDDRGAGRAAQPDAATPTRPISLIAYCAAAGLAAPLAAQLLKARARQGKEDPARLAERLGHASAPAAGRPAGVDARGERRGKPLAAAADRDAGRGAAGPGDPGHQRHPRLGRGAGAAAAGRRHSPVCAGGHARRGPPLPRPLAPGGGDHSSKASCGRT